MTCSADVPVTNISASASSLSRLTKNSPLESILTGLAIFNTLPWFPEALFSCNVHVDVHTENATALPAIASVEAYGLPQHCKPGCASLSEHGGTYGIMVLPALPGIGSLCWRDVRYKVKSVIQHGIQQPVDHAQRAFAHERRTQRSAPPMFVLPTISSPNACTIRRRFTKRSPP
ncbi:hypothetical protein PYCCODRAFT_1047791 [Trametes coccinea BRFM310]|uniref:Uncharacterized protein n=1 Tax=Trametes coccinea (strain BRFM310) TaxID=1353009 RepID=A0A1Y2I9Y4_TRAC3|nr:hypothetical protein PYCCODRAFT_1047791 [Trametes coccinea BRFM310]